ncbi:hypothetical protein BGW38_003865 [Lunasporangiospora selenospora]|uniref:Protein-S-isoprenylcysteine O-methyltransferase n=1 Tax=Lunasporangiospora selenospora TaxID=979761 RepID=A0A9P6FQV9_9FUNG|nr:hypothetical protein BGW38_003865 [Lunasporangiospora selenospora]
MHYTLMIRRGHRLVQDGPYKYLIHPSYTGLYISLASFLVTLTYDGLWPTFIKPRLPVPVSGLLLLLVHLVFYFGLLFLRIQKEEKMLSQHFGSEWDEYVSRRWRMIPFVY